MSQLDRLKNLIEPELLPETDDLLIQILDNAKHIILLRRYPFGDFPLDEFGQKILESKYNNLQLDISVYIFNKLGAEGQLSHSENGITRNYDSSYIPNSMLGEVVPKVGTF